MSPYTAFLFARPSFLEGVARLFDFGGTLNEYNSSLTPQQADELALAADWTAVCDDLRLAYQQSNTRLSIPSAHRQLRAGRRRHR